MDTEKSQAYIQSSKELRFVISVEQMIPFLNRISDTKRFNDDRDVLDACEPNEINEIDEISDQTNHLTTDIVVPLETTTIDTSAPNALPNIYEEYVNFIDLSVLNPIIDADTCQKDRLIESEISEL